MENARESVRDPDLESAWHLLNLAAGPVPALIGGWLGGLALVGVLEPPLALLNVVGFVGGLVSGLLGVGGAIVMTPLLLYAPRLFYFPPLDMHTVSGITMVQVAVAGTVAVFVHRRGGHVDGRLVKKLGAAVVVGSFIGATASKFVSARWLEGVFATLALLTVLLMPLRLRASSEGVTEPSRGVSTVLALAIGLPIGLVVGLIGSGGGFLLVPIMLHLLGVPPRTAVGTSLAIVALSSIAGAGGKLIADQVDGLRALALVVGGVPGAQAGATMSGRVPSRRLMIMFAAFVGAAAVRMWWELLR